MSDPVLYPVPSSNSGVKTAVVAGALVALVAANIYLYIQVDRLHTDMAKMQEALMTEISNLRETSSVTTASQKKHLETLKDELTSRRGNRPPRLPARLNPMP